MKKLLSLASILLFANAIIAQCPTCHDGKHDYNPNEKTDHKRFHDGSGTLGQSYIQQNVCGLNYVAASVMTTTRYTSPPFCCGPGFPCGDTIAGLPTGCLTILKAFVYYGVSYTEATAPSTSVTITNPGGGSGTYAATTTGTAPSVCWAESGTACYRADVTPTITTNGVYTINLTGFANANYEVDGITLIIIYTSPQTWTGSIVLYDGCMSNSTGAPMSDTGTGFTTCAAATTANAFSCTGDMQSNTGTANNTETYNGSTVTFPNMFWNFNVIPTTLTAGQTTCVYNAYTNNAGSDCWQWDLAGLYWQNTGCVTCSTTTGTLTLSMTETNASCGASNGTATVTTTGGTAPYTYSWAPAGGAAATASGLSAGKYVVTVKDASCDIGIDSIIVNTNNGPRDSIIATTNVTCFGGNNGSATVGYKNGTAPYTFSWAPSGGAAATASNLTAGSYTVTVTDATGCIVTAIATITGPTQLRDSISAFTNVLCNGGNNGSATVGVKGGTLPYTYSWNTAPVQTTPTASNLTAGTYIVTVTDANGCSVTATATITQPTALSTTSSTTTATCNQSNGSATVTPAGGTPAYTYSWNTVPVQITPTASNISAGSYVVTVTDANGCTITATIVVPNANGPRDSISATTNVTCYNGNNGNLTVGVKNGTAPYTYSWAPAGGAAATASNLSAGSYTVTVTDVTGCTTTAIGTVTQPSQLRDSVITVKNEPCFGNSLGAVTTGVKGGTTPYTFSWTGGGNVQNPTNMSAGAYVVTVTDANGCTTTANTTITQPTAVNLTAAGFPASCNGECNGQAAVIPNGGTPGYTYLWSTTSTVASLTGLCAGNYQITVTDVNGCQHDTTVTVTQPTAITTTPSSVTAHCGQADGSASITAAGGSPGYTYSWNTGAVTTSITNVTPGNYTVVVTDANKCTDTTIINVPNAAGDSAGITSTTNVTCNGGNNGSATALGYKGTPGYTYSWSTVPIQTTPTASTLTAGSYTVTVTDATGCPTTAIAVITQPALVVSTAPAPQTICIGSSATLTATAVGGTPAYTFKWNPGALTGATVTVSPVITTTYTITTADVNGCPGAQVMVTVTVNPPLAVTTGPTKAACPGDSVKLSATATGGNGNYTYTWTPPTGLGCTVCQNPSASPGTTTIYTVTVTDNCGTPAATATETAIVDPLPVVAFTADTTRGCYPLCINFKDMTTIASGGIKSWNWTFGDGGKSSTKDTTYCYQNAGLYTVGLTVISDSGCMSNKTVNNMITVYPHPVAAFTASPQPATILNPTITYTDKSSDTAKIISWFWTFGDPLDGTSNIQNPSYTYADTGTFCATLTVTDVHGCVDSVTNCEVVEPFFTLYIPNAFSPNADGRNDVFMPKGMFVCGFQMYIFDRWGMQLYYTEDMSKGWDGRVNGGSNIAQEDTYVYLIYAIDCINFSKHTYIGKVSIVQ